ncbi:hypothetical protein [Runella sp.]|uniref:hypothetical protein n=1 Tax=Runella sp. TaxID=1960881 RepID=UPI003D0A2965
MKLFKYFAIVLLLSCTACSSESSPEGRSKIRDEKLQAEIEHLNRQNRAVLDSLSAIRTELNALKNQK